MTSSQRDTGLLILIPFITLFVCPPPGARSDDLPRSSLVGPWQIPLVSYERVPIGTVLTHPDRYHMKEIRLTGTVTAIRTEAIADRRTCGRAYERTILMVEDDSGTIEVVDQGACGRNLSPLRAPMLTVGQRIDLMVLIISTITPDMPGPSLEIVISFLDLARS